MYEQKLAWLLWKVDFKDIVLVDSVEDILLPSRKKVMPDSARQTLYNYTDYRGHAV